ncbi:MAG: cysteine--tRNA ligase [Micrococcales bacterium 73-13]|nr:MAG: cysteine--tRNA ligase [Micrococcales bacterium 73-13]
MGVRLYDTKAREVVDLAPRVPGRVGIYVCGPTVQSSPHVGHLRSALVYDLWRRWLAHRGYEVTLVRNVTDIDDKILVAAEAAGDPERWWALAYRVELEFSRAYAAIGILPPTYEPRATASIGEMLSLTATLIERGHAYPAADGSGDVYFDTGSWAPYGELTGQRREDMQDAEDADPRGKRDPRDFALWKGRKPSEPASASWPSPWGAGRPGWHLECSAMSRRYLGGAFDIHGGGLDLRFPHHENELAQSRAAGDGFARHWLHNGLVTVDGQKMSKSLGNSVFAHDVLAQAEPAVVRYLLAAAHYRSTIDLHDGSLAEAAAAVERIESFLLRSGRALAVAAPAAPAALEVPEVFAAAMDDDLGVPQALAVLHETVRAGNAALDAGDLAAAARSRAEVAAMTGVLGLDLGGARTDDAATAALGVLVEGMLERRAAARAQQDYRTADEVRAALAAAGIAIEDGPDATHWSLS